jgi:hypothetical protein
MVGTSAMVALFKRRLSSARRNAGTVRTIMGLRGIWTRSVRSGRRRLLTLRREAPPYQSRRVVAKQSVEARANGGELSVEAASDSKCRRVASAIHR